MPESVSIAGVGKNAVAQERRARLAPRQVLGRIEVTQISILTFQRTNKVHSHLHCIKVNLIANKTLL